MNLKTLRANAWPIGIVGIVCCFFIADGLLITTALRDKATAPEQNYYEKAIHFDDSRALLGRTQAAGLSATLRLAEVPSPTMPRLIDVQVRDKNGPVQGLSGTLTAVRPADARLINTATLVPVPGEDGLYRLLLRIPVSGLWEFQLDAKRGTDAYRLVMRQNVTL